MPELPEVETVRIQLLHKIVGKKITGVEVFHSKSVRDDESFEEKLVGKEIVDIDRVGKLMIFSFSQNKDLFMMAHLKMTGQFFYVAEGEISGGGHSATDRDWQDLPNRHTRVAIYFQDKSVLYFNDMRIFGYLQLADREEVEKARRKFGPEPIQDDFDTEWFYKSLRKKKTSIKAALLNQQFVAGLGNIYVDEALYRAGVSPTRKADKVTKAEAAAIAAASGEVMKESIAVGGTTFQHFADTGGKRGNFVEYLQVFGRQGQKCIKCGTKIEKIRCAGRGTHFCPICQK